MVMKYCSIRCLAGFLFYGSFAGGFLAGAQYGIWVGCVTFVILAISGFILHKVADKLRQTKL
jgi:hypothetical protein